MISSYNYAGIKSYANYVNIKITFVFTASYTAANKSTGVKNGL